MSKSNVEAIYPLSPMQQGMLFHSLYDSSSGFYIQQLNFKFGRGFDVPAFKRAWQHVVDRHPILRTLFMWDRRDKPLQVVRQQVELPWIELDWREQSPEEQSANLALYLQRDQERGFDLAKAPLIRMTLVRLTDDSYQFIWSHHHILLDGWSVPLVFRELLSFYTAYAQGQNVTFDRPRPYRDYITWLQKQNLAAAERFWRDLLAGFQTATPLGIDHLSGIALEAKDQYAKQERLLSTHTTAALQALARQHLLTLNTLVQGAWALLLGCYSGEHDVVFGATVAGRPADLPGVEGMIGLFINTLPVRVRIRPDQPLLGWLTQLQAQQVEMRQYEYTPLVQIQGWSDVPNGQPLFESLVVFENYPVSEVAQEQENGLEILSFEATERTNYPVTVVAGAGNELMLRISYDRNRLNDSQIVRMHRHLQTILEAIANNPQQRVADVPVLSAVEQQQLVEAGRPRLANPLPVACLHHLFAHQAAETPNALALTCDDQHLSYAHLDAHANQLAHLLQHHGVGPETRVALLLERSLDLVVVVLAILKAGAAYVPLDPAYPADRLRFMVDDARVALLLTQSSLADILPALDVPTLQIDTLAARLVQLPTTPPAGSVTPDHLAYIIYTSGSTGTPKGAMLTHAHVARLFAATASWFHFDHQDVWTLFHSIAFDFSVWELWGPLLSGGRLVVVPYWVSRTPDAFLDLLVREQITVLNQTPTAFRQLIHADTSRTPAATLALRYVIFGGEALDLASLAPWFARHGDERPQLVNMYGITETTVHVTYRPLTQADVTTGQGSLIGVPIPDLALYLLDAHLRPVPLGVTGELYVGGAGVARGYLHRPALTAERFVPDPFSQVPGARLYRSGDLARRVANDDLEYLGRIDQQVKIRGFRIELGEIETVLLKHEMVREVVVLARADEAGEKRLVAYVVLSGPAAPDLSAALRAFVRQQLPDYMVPAAVVVLTALPLTTNGKLDRNALPTPGSAGIAAERYIAPRTPIEDLLAGIWAEVLQRERVSVQDNFFALGGHSLLATQVISRIRAVFARELPLRTLFEAPTIAELAAHMIVPGTGTDEQGAPPIMPVERSGPLPLSFAQERLWFLDQLDPGNSIYNIPMPLYITGPLDSAALEYSLNALVARHEILRTTITVINDQPVQIIAPSASIALHTVDLAALPAAEREAAVQTLIDTESKVAFDLAHGPLVRCSVLCLGPAEQVLLLNMHHIITDAWSMAVFIDELSHYYRAYHSGQPANLAPLPIQYADYAVWQRQWLHGAVFESQVQYWRDQLAGLPLLELPTDRPRPPLQTFNGASESVSLSASLTEGVQALSRREGVTLFMTLLAAFQMLLARYSGQPDFAVGTPIAGRTRAETEGLIGFFVNTLVLRADLHNNPTFRELLQRVRATTLDAYAHQDLPFERLVEELQPTRDLSRSPLFQVMFVFQNTPQTAIELPDLTLQSLSTDQIQAKFDLTLTLYEVDAQIQGELEYNSDLFDARTMRQLVGNLETLLSAIIAAPEQRVADVPVLTAVERQQLLSAWNATATDYPRDRCIHELFAQQVARTPDAVAVVYEDQQLTYHELNCRANQLAHHLQALGVGGHSQGEVCVGICLDHSITLIVAVLAVLKAGSTYVPLDPSVPSARLGFMIEDTQAPVILTEQRFQTLLPAHPGSTVYLDCDWPTIARRPTTDPIYRATADMLAYVIYTSGSTGQPKGVLVTHQAMLNNLAWRQHTWPLTQDDRVLLNFAISFDPSLWNICWPLSAGAQLVIINQEQRVDSAALVRTIAEQRITLFGATPSHLTVLLDEPAITACTSLRYVISGGEQLSGEVQQQFHAALDAILCNCYGPTEATIDTTFWISERSDTLQAAPIGRPIDNTQVYLLDRRMEPVPVGVPGELYIGGAGLARGYLTRPDLTAAQFVPHPFSTELGGRLYKTGDLARYRPDGQIEFVGRIDQQVKLRGFRIELREIETALLAHPAVRDVVVLARQDQPGEIRLVAYVVAAAGEVPSSAALRSFLQQKLPDYMVPATYLVLPALPLTANGKLDRNALPAPDTQANAAHAFVAPSTPLEDVVAGILSAVLGCDHVSPHDDFFALGGHSLLATQVVSRIRTTFGVELPVRAIFETPTVAALAQQIAAARQTDVLLQAPPLVPVPRDGTPLPLSFAQERLWFLDQLQPDSALYTIPLPLYITGPLDIPALEHSLNALVARHESLRTTFVSVDGRPMQRIAPMTPHSLTRLDLQAVPAHARDAHLQAQIEAEVQRPFALDCGPLLRATLLTLGATEHVLVLNMHHIITDGWSMTLLLDELAMLYQAQTSQQPAALPPLALQYADFALWQRQWLQGPVLAAQLNYWQQEVAALPILDLPTDHPRPPVQTAHGATAPVMLSPTLSQAVQGLSQREGVTPFMTLLAAFQVLLARYSGQTDLAVGTVIAGRNHADLERIVGFFVNTLVLRTRLDDNPSFRELLHRVRETTLGAYAHQDLPFESLVEALQPTRDLSRSPLFQVVFTWQNLPPTTVEPTGLAFQPMSSERHTAKFDLTLALEARDGTIGGSVEYNTDLFAATTIQRMITHFAVLLEAIVAAPNQRVAALPLVTTLERQQLLCDWNATATEYPRDRCIPDLFAAQVAQAPGAVALVFADQHLTYAELDARANQLAHHLQALGVGGHSQGEVCVGICLDRSINLIVGVLAILKAGGAYLPLDPAYPTERIAFMIQDAQAPVILTEQRFQTLLPTHPGATVYLDHDWPTIARRPTTDPIRRATANMLAYVMYTSGSTGRPKGTCITHRAITRLVCNTDYAQLTPDDRVMHASNTAFDAATFEIWGPLLNGALLVGIDRETALEPNRFAAMLREQQITAAFMTTAWFNQVVSSVPEAFGGLRHVLFGGEACDPQRVRDVLHLGAPDRLLHVYGPTESTTFASWYEVPALSADAVTVPIGRALANTQIYLLDPQLQLVPVGVPGELYIGGDGLARGYLNRPDLTAEKFVPDSVSGTPGARLYRTGDLARYRADGQIEFLARIDQQVKLRGFRIELGEIEAALLAHPAVRDAVVLARRDIPGEARLVAYVVSASSEVPRNTALRSFLQQKLPDYMVPSAFVILDALPLTANGKVDRRALPAPDTQTSAGPGSYVAPSTPLEDVIAGIWSAVLGCDRVSRHDDFFALGGHSLLATQVVSRIRATCAVELPVRAIFETPTLAALAQQIAAARQSEALPPAPPLLPVPRDQQLPLSFAQERLWFLDQLQPGSPAYNVPLPLRIQGDLDITALEHALSAIVARHEILRTTIGHADGTPVQVIAAAQPVQLPLTDLQSLPADQRERRAQQAISADAVTPFDLTNGPLFRCSLVRHTPKEHTLLLTMHHSVTDGWSVGVLTRELLSGYQAYCRGQPVNLPELPVQYADYAVWQRQWLQGTVLEGQLRYWQQQLAGFRALELPTDRPRPPIQTFNGTAAPVNLPPVLSDALIGLSQRAGSSLFMTLLAAFQVLLARYSGQHDFAVGTPIAGRTRAEVEPLIGFFVNTLVLRADLQGNPTFHDLLQRVRETTLDAYTHQDLPFERLVEELHPARDLSRSPLFQVSFALQNTPMEIDADQLPDLTLSIAEVESTVSKFDLTLTLQELPSGLTGAVTYNTDLFDATTIERLIAHFQQLLEAIVVDPDRRLGEYAFLTAAEQRQLLVDWNSTTPADSAPGSIVALMTASAERTPEAVAVVYEDQQLTYRELDQRANQLAQHLQLLGVGPDVRVGILLERSLDLIVGLVAVLKAGGAYVPLDPTYPAERSAFVLADAGVSVLLTQQPLLNRLPSRPAQTVCLDNEWEVIARQSPQQPHSDATAANLAYVIYTSGSTGQPKGVGVEHRQLANYVHAIQERLALPAGAGYATVSTIAADLGHTVVFPALCSGGTLHVIAEDRLANPERFAEYVAEHPIDCLKIVPSHMAALLTSPRAATLIPPRLVFGGEACPWSLIDQIHALAPGCSILNHYGPTETTVGVLTYAVTRDPAAQQRSATVPLGRPLANSQVYLLDTYLHPVPVGIPGEVYIGGAGVTRGYLHRPALTAERFIPDPFSGCHAGALRAWAPAEAGKRLYRTGDRARYLPDGTIEFLGRVDHQVKVRGFRIELGEIEATLLRHPQVREVVVVVRADAANDPRLVAYVVPRQPTSTSDDPQLHQPTASALRAFLKERLPEYMLPTAWVLLPALPLTPNGKLDRSALPSPETADAYQGQRFVAPRDDLEFGLAQIWQAILSKPAIGVTDAFFDSGGHSLAAVRLVSQIQRRFGVALPLAVLFQAPTIEQLARILRQQSDSLVWSPSVALQPRGARQPFFCVHPAGGNVLCYAELAQQIGPEQPFYGLQAPGLHDDQALPTTVEALAAYYLTAVRAQQPDGPYFLGGWSAGGVIAFEMARQLAQQGEQVGRLILLDSMLVREAPAIDDHDSIATIAEEFQIPADHLPTHLDPDRQLAWILEQAKSTARIPPDLTLEQLRRVLKLEQAIVGATRSYGPSSAYTGPITLIRAQEIPVDGMPEDLGWSDVCGAPLEIVFTPGNHLTMMNPPHVAVLAGLLRSALNSGVDVEGVVEEANVPT